MTENVLDVLMYLFETYTDTDIEPEPDRSALRDELERAGFAYGEIEKALEWLDGLAAREEDPGWQAPTERATRVFSDHEHLHLDSACRGYLMYLEHIGILPPAQRELVIDRLMRAFLAGKALRKKGTTDPNYVDQEVLDHGNR